MRIPREHVLHILPVAVIMIIGAVGMRVRFDDYYDFPVLMLVAMPLISVWLWLQWPSRRLESSPSARPGEDSTAPSIHGVARWGLGSTCLKPDWTAEGGGPRSQWSRDSRR